MNKRFILSAVLLICAVLFTPQMSSALGLELGVGYWGQDPSGDIAYKAVDKLDIKDDLNYGEEYKPFFRAKAELPLMLPNIYFMATPMKFEETGSTTQNFTFGDTVYDVTAAFESKLEMTNYDICLYYSLPFIKTATADKLNVEFGLNVRIMDFEASITGTELGASEVTESESMTIPVPMIYAGVQLNPVDLVGIEAEVKAISYNSNHYYDVIGRVKLKPAGPFYVAGGYRLNDLEIDESDVEASVKFSGPFFEAGVSF